MIKRKILDDISSGKWTFDVTAPKVFEALRESTDPSHMSLEDSSLTFLSAKRYLSIQLEVTNHSVPNDTDFTYITSNHKTESWQEAVTTIFPGSKLKVGDGKLVQMSIDYLLKVNPLLYSDIPKWIKHFVFLQEAPWLGASSPYTIGTIYLGEKIQNSNHIKLSESIVHEAGHQELFLINFYDRLVNSAADYNLVHSPLRGKDRPPIGRLHALIAIFRMHQLHKGTAMAEVFQDKFNATFSSFASNELTEFADSLIRKLQNQVNA